MTKINTTYDNTCHTPTREEFHRTFGGILTQADFDTGKPATWNINKISRTLKEISKA